MGKYYRPSAVSDATEWLAGHEGAEVVAGAQTMTLHLRQGLKSPAALVDISERPALRGVSRTDEAMTIGSTTTYAELEGSSLLRAEFPFFTDAIAQVAGPQVRHNGTIAGGLCYGDPALDTPLVLLTLDATLEFESADTSRTLPITEFYTGYYETALKEGELLTTIRVPTLPPNSGGSYLTMAPRQGDYAIAGVATRLTLADDDTWEEARIALTNGGGVPMRATDAEDALEGAALEREVVGEAVAAVREALDILEDVQTPKSYRETIFQRLTKQGINDAHDAASEAND